MNSLVAIVGPTGTGKSRLALQLAHIFNGEIIGADSRQLYRCLDIGTAKPTPAEQAEVPHHLIDIITPDDDFSLAKYQEMACEAVSDIQRRGRLPLLAGGSGLYVWAVLEGWVIPRVTPDPELRQKLEERAGLEGGEALYRELALVDPAAAGRIDPRNIRRVIRALEINRIGAGAPEARAKQPPSFRTLVIGLTADRRELYRRVDARVDEMVGGGLIDEVKALLDRGYSPDLPAMSSLGYRQIGQYLRGELVLEEAVSQMKTETHRFIRHQYNWFRLTDERIKWFDIGTDFGEEAGRLVADFLREES